MRPESTAPCPGQDSLSLSLGIRNYKFIRNQIIPKQKKTENFKGLVFLINANYGLIGSRAAFSHMPGSPTVELGPDFWGTKSWKTMLEGCWVVGARFPTPLQRRHSYQCRPHFTYFRNISP